MRALLATSILLTLPAVAEAKTVCGPSGAETLARGAESRVYVTGATAYGCHRDRTRALKLGARSRILGVTLAAQRAVVRRPIAGGEQLRLYDLRRGLAQVHKDVGATVEAVRVDRTGIAMFVARQPDGVRVLDAVRGGFAPVRSPDIDPASLRLVAGTLAWREGATLRVHHLRDGREPAAELAELGGVRITVNQAQELVARRGSEPSQRLGVPLDTCASSSGCGGVDAIQVAGPYLAFRRFASSIGTDAGSVTVLDDRGSRQVVCDIEPGGYTSSHLVGAFVLTETGGVACTTVEGADIRIRTPAAILDEGPKIDVASLQRRGDQLVWRNDGVEHTAPLP